SYHRPVCERIRPPVPEPIPVPPGGRLRDDPEGGALRVSLPLTIVLSLSVVSATAQNGPAPSAATPQVAQAQGGGRGQGPAGGARGGRGGRGAEAAPPQVLIEGPSLGYVHTLAPLWWPASAGVQESTAGIGTTS